MIVKTLCFTKPPKYSAKATYQKNRQICYSVGNSIPNKLGSYVENVIIIAEGGQV